MLPGAKKDPQLITSDWHRLQDPIDGVVVREVAHVPGNFGVLTEIYRPEWDPTGLPIAQIFFVRVFPGAVSAWHCHKVATDRIFVNQGHMKIVLFDEREASPSYGRINEFWLGEARPAMLVIPPEIWHGVHNLGGAESGYVNFPSRAYHYEDPDHYRLPRDTPHIPYSWTKGLATHPAKSSTGEPQ